MKQLSLPVEVRKSNAIIRAKWQPKNVWEPRLVALVAVQIKPSDKDFHTYKIPVADLMGEESAHQLGGENYRRLREVAKRIVGSVIEIENPEAQEFAMYGIFSKCAYKDGAFHVRFDPDLKPHFLQLKDHYTKYNLLEFKLLAGTYAQRIFEILKSWDDKPEVKLDLADLQDRLVVPESLRKRWPDFRRRVLEPAHREISRKTSFDFEWEPVKRGRAVAGIRFIFVKKRAEPVVKVKKASADQKQTKDRNAVAKKAIACRDRWVKSGGSCNADQGAVCAACKLLYG